MEDLNEFDYIQEFKKKNNETGDDDIVQEQHHISYPSLINITTANKMTSNTLLSIYGQKRRNKKIAHVVTLLFLILHYYNLYKYYPNIDNKQHMNQLSTLSQDLSLVIDDDDDNFQSRQVQQIIRGLPYCISPISSIIGGLYAQDILKSITNKGQPYANFVLYNSMKGPS